MKKIWIKETKDKIGLPAQAGQEVFVAGWVQARRDHGKLIFIDLRDRSGILQVVFIPQNKEVYEKAQQLRSEWVVGLKGQINQRPKGMENAEIPTGQVEMLATSIEIYSEAKTPAFSVETDGKELDEAQRLKYRYLDLRRPRLQKNLIMRHKIEMFMRQWLTERDFVEIETPILTKSTPEGARDYVVPSRLQPGSFYALPQSPQQYKQLLMVAGMERYFQIARCLRDEDARGDRQPEFTQLDIEMSFIEQEDILRLIEDLYADLVKKILPDHSLSQSPFPRLTYKESMEKYGSDKPDLRKDKNNPKELAFAFVVDFPMFEKDKEGNWTSAHHPFTMMKKDHLKYLETGEYEKIYADSYDLVLNGYELASGSIRITDPEIQKKVFEVFGMKQAEIMEKFGHMIEAFSHGVPPHGGIAPGIDRFVMLVQDEPNIREVFAFPKTGDGRDLMMQAPSPIDEKQMKELKLEIKKLNK